MNKIQTEIVSPDFLGYNMYLINYNKRSSRSLFCFFTHPESGDKPFFFLILLSLSKFFYHRHPVNYDSTTQNEKGSQKMVSCYLSGGYTGI